MLTHRRLHLPHRRAEHGFTLIEMLVAMLLMSIVLGLTAQALVGGSRQERRVADQKRAATSLAGAIERIRNDLSTAQSPGRYGLTMYELRDALHTTQAGVDDARDILQATPWSITVRAQVTTESGVSRSAQCITWNIQNGWLTRTVQSAAATGGIPGWTVTGATTGTTTSTACRGAVLGVERVAPMAQLTNVPAGNYAVTNLSTPCATTNLVCMRLHHPPLFRYVELVNDTQVGAESLAAAHNEDDCQRVEQPPYTYYNTAATATASAAQRAASINRIGAVDIDLRARYGAGVLNDDGSVSGVADAKTASSASSVSITTRTLSARYLQALGCAA